jgi:IS5 family transposase
MGQITFAFPSNFEKFARASRRAQFLNTVDSVVPWSELEAIIEPHYPKAGKGRHPVGLGIMLRIYLLQHWFNLSDPGAEHALYDSHALRSFAGVDLCRAAAPDETTILNFRHLLRTHNLRGKILDKVNLDLASKGMRISTGTIVDARIIPVPSATKGEKKERDAGMFPTRKVNQDRLEATQQIGMDN